MPLARSSNEEIVWNRIFRISHVQGTSEHEDECSTQMQPRTRLARLYHHIHTRNLILVRSRFYHPLLEACGEKNCRTW
jgi:hypothetical protein